MSASVMALFTAHPLSWRAGNEIGIEFCGFNSEKIIGGNSPYRLGKRARLSGGYSSWVEMLPKLVFSLVPMPFTAAIMTNAIPAAIKPYSMAVAPDSSRRNLIIRCTENSTSAAETTR
jgi:hypothetical protein